MAIFAASPFLSDHLVGTGEAHNYGLAVGDAIRQLRAGEAPFVGQTELAYNGRVHPLRAAPALFYTAGLLDFVTFRQLSPWQVQNLCLALALFATPWLAFVTLRRWLHVPDFWAAAIAGLLGLMPSLLINAHGLNLFMTVLAVPGVVVATAATAAMGRCPRPSLDWALAISLSFVWWAHPPLGTWTTLALGPLRVWILVRTFSWVQVRSLFVPYCFAALLVQFVFVSVFTSQAHILRDASTEEIQKGYGQEVMAVLSDRFPENLLPVSREAGLGSDLQLGWALALAWGLLLWRARPEERLSHEKGSIGKNGLFAASLVFALVCFPWPGIDHYFWSQLPGSLSAQTNIWPMQRLWVIAPIFAWFAAARVLPLQTSPRALQVVASLFMVATGWSLYQGFALVDRGWRSQRSAEESHRALLPTNIDITQTAYGMLAVPPDYTQGGVAPWALFRTRAPSGEILADNLVQALAQSSVVQELPLAIDRVESGSLALAGSLQLKPRTHYLLEFVWNGPTPPGLLLLRSENIERLHPLPAAPGDRAFGVTAGRIPALTLSNDGGSTENLRLSLQGSDYLRLAESGVTSFGVARLRIVSIEKLPVRVDSLFPLRFKTDTENAGFVETPRRFIAGYDATVDGFPTEVKESPWGNVMVSVPAGPAHTQLNFEAPALLRVSLATALFGWLVIAVWVWVSLSRLPATQSRPLRALPAFALAVWIIALGVWAWAARPVRVQVPIGAGPLILEFRTSLAQVGRNQIVASSGTVGAGHFVAFEYRADNYARLTWETWGNRVSSDWIPFKPESLQTLVIDAAPFNASPGAPPVQRNATTNDVRIDFNGTTVLKTSLDTFNVTASEIVLGASRIGGGFAEHVFDGTLLSARRLTSPAPVPLHFGPWPLRFRSESRPDLPRVSPLIDFGGNAGVLTLERDSTQSVRLVWKDAGQRRIQSESWRWQPGQTLIWELQPDDQSWLVSVPLTGVVLKTPVGTRSGSIMPAARLGALSTPYPGVPSLATHLDSRLVAPPPQTHGPFHAIVALRPDFSGQPQPLLATGRTGRADVLFVRPVAEGQVQFGLDHWGLPAYLSPVVNLDLKKPFSFSFSTGSLSSGGKALDKEEEVVLSVNGQEVWRFSLLTYPFEPEEVFLGDNSLGASSAVRLLEGKILESGRGELPSRLAH